MCTVVDIFWLRFPLDVSHLSCNQLFSPFTFIYTRCVYEARFSFFSHFFLLIQEVRTSLIHAITITMQSSGSSNVKSALENCYVATGKTFNY